MTSAQANLAGTPIALGIAAAFGYLVPRPFCRYTIDEQGRTCLLDRPITKDEHAQA